MELTDRLSHVAVLGAAGKMGSGIVYVLLQEIMRLNLAETATPARLIYCFDQSEERLMGLVSYLKTQFTKDAEKNIVALRRVEKYVNDPQLVDNSEFIQKYVDDALLSVRLTTALESLQTCHLIFEAVFENLSAKVELFRSIQKVTKVDPWYFTNTSSIPISVIDKGAELSGRLIGFHFYNPPAVQKLVEVIPSQQTPTELLCAAQELGKRLRKTLIESSDVAGFIGNGHFMRDILHAASEVTRLSVDFTETDAIYMVNSVTQDFMIRPMGIFQLVDYVGIEVCMAIMNVMTQNLNGEKLECPLLERYLAQDIRGGQRSDGSQKDGIFQYDKNTIIGQFNLQSRKYETLDPGHKDRIWQKLGSLPRGHLPWKNLVSNPNKGSLLNEYWENLKISESVGAKIAWTYLQKSKKIGEQLLKTGVAKSADDVNTVLTQGFFHLYGPISDVFKSTYIEDGGEKS